MSRSKSSVTTRVLRSHATTSIGTFNENSIFDRICTNIAARRDLAMRLPMLDKIEFSAVEPFLRLVTQSDCFQRLHEHTCNVALLTAIALHASMRVHFTEVAQPGRHTWTTSQLTCLVKAIIMSDCIDALIATGPRWESYAMIIVPDMVFALGNSSHHQIVAVLCNKTNITVTLSTPDRAQDRTIEPWLEPMLDLAAQNRLHFDYIQSLEFAKTDYIWPIHTLDEPEPESDSIYRVTNNYAAVTAVLMLLTHYHKNVKKSAAMLSERPLLLFAAVDLYQRQERMYVQLDEQSMIVEETLSAIRQRHATIRKTEHATDNYLGLALRGKCTATLQQARQSLQLRWQSTQEYIIDARQAMQITIAVLRTCLFDMVVTLQQCMTLITKCVQPFPIDVVLQILVYAEYPYAESAHTASIAPNERNIVRDIISAAVRATLCVYSNTERNLHVHHQRTASVAGLDTNEHRSKSARRAEAVDDSNNGSLSREFSEIDDNE